MIEGEDDEYESELGYLQEIRKIRDSDPALFEKIKKLPKKARTARKSQEDSSELLTYFRKGKLKKFFIVKSDKNSISTEIDFIEAAKKLEAKQNEKRSKLKKLFYKMLKKNLEMLKKIDEYDIDEYSLEGRGGDNAVRLSKILKSKEIKKYQKFTDDEEIYIKHVINELDSGGIPKKITQKLYKKIHDTPEIIKNPIKLLAVLKTTLPSDFLQPTQNDIYKGIDNKKEIILSEYFNAE
jgi:hypothetical protein